MLYLGKPMQIQSYTSSFGSDTHILWFIKKSVTIQRGAVSEANTEDSPHTLTTHALAHRPTHVDLYTHISVKKTLSTRQSFTAVNQQV